MNADTHMLHTLIHNDSCLQEHAFDLARKSEIERKHPLRLVPVHQGVAVRLEDWAPTVEALAMNVDMSKVLWYSLAAQIVEDELEVSRY